MFDKLKESFYRFRNNSSPILNCKDKYNNFMYIIKDGDYLTEIEETKLQKLANLKKLISSIIINRIMKQFLNYKKSISNNPVIITNSKLTSNHISDKNDNKSTSKKKRRNRRRRRQRKRKYNKKTKIN